MREPREVARSWTLELARPLPLVAVLVLALNDHVLKHARLLPGWLTGKLSDVAGLFFFPVLLFALSCWWFGAPRSSRGRLARAVGLAAATGLVFALVKVVPVANGLANQILGVVVLDPSDLLALPFAAASVLYLARAPAPGVGASSAIVAHARRAAVFLAALASMATSAPQRARNYPFWEVRGAPRQGVGCVELSAEIVKSGKTGIGVVVSRDVDRECVVTIEGARVRVGEVSAPALALPPWDDMRTTYLGFAFDNEALWNDGLREGSLELDVRVSDRRATIRFPMTHVWSGPHENSRRPASAPPRPPTTSMPLAAPETEDGP